MLRLPVLLGIVSTSISFSLSNPRFANHRAAIRRPSSATDAADAETPTEAVDRWAGWTVEESGLKYFDSRAGTGETPNEGGTVTVNYVGRTSIDGKPQETFDDSYKRGFPFKFVLGEGKVIPGWDAGLRTMKVGAKRTLIIPPELAYGNRTIGGGLIPPNSELCFECELLEVGPAGQGSMNLFIEDAQLQIKQAFENRFFTVFFAIYVVSFFLPPGFIEGIMAKF